MFKQVFKFDKEDAKILGTMLGGMIAMITLVLLSVFYAGDGANIATLNMHGGKAKCTWTDGKMAVMTCENGHRRLIDLEGNPIKIGATYVVKQGMPRTRFTPGKMYLSSL